MMSMFGGASRGAIVKLRCPHCREIQARARGQKKYTCRKCKKVFTREEGEAAAKDADE
jgi:transposase-like protein